MSTRPIVKRLQRNRVHCCWDDNGPGHGEEYMEWHPVMPLCVACGRLKDPDGPDPCMGMLPGVSFACCGHGCKRMAYVAYANGATLRHDEALARLRVSGADIPDVEVGEAGLQGTLVSKHLWVGATDERMAEEAEFFAVELGISVAEARARLGVSER